MATTFEKKVVHNFASGAQLEITSDRVSHFKRSPIEGVSKYLDCNYLQTKKTTLSILGYEASPLFLPFMECASL